MADQVKGSAPASSPKEGTEDANFEELASSGGRDSRDIDFILDIPLEVSVKLGASRMMIKDLLSLSQGSVVELDKLAGEPMDVYVNDRLIAKGEVVVVNEKFGIRLTDVLSPAERIKQLS